MRARLLPVAVLLALVLSVTGATTAPLPHRLPAAALGAALVWRVEITAITFIVAYVAIVTIRLSLHGRTFTHVGSRGIEIPEVLSHAEAERETEVAAAEVETSLADLKTSVEQLDSRLRTLERARDVVLHSNTGDLA
jgi:hypothetical protein